jgi:hypothetical protein
LDIDLFTDDEGLFGAARSVLRRPGALGSAGELETTRTDVHLCQFLLHSPGGEIVKIDLVRDIPVQLTPKVALDDVWLDSLTDLAANKMGCLVQREDVKDHVDLFYLIPHLGLDADAAMALGRKKEAGLDPVILAEQLRWIESRPRPDFLRTDVPWENVLHFFARFREDVLRLVEPGRR